MSIARPLHPLFHRVLVAMLLACSFACCCQQRTLAALVSGDDPAPVAAGCCDGCCARETDADGATDDRTSQSPSERERHPVGRCENACCTKADFKAPQFTVGSDEIGAPLDSILIAREAPADVHATRATRLDDDVGEPPPWILLLVSARLRI
ncbi:MAG: hypothetical protein RLY21_453 [Planctomycetota bacterium]|jgi:hypothetical protein